MLSHVSHHECNTSRQIQKSRSSHQSLMHPSVLEVPGGGVGGGGLPLSVQAAARGENSLRTPPRSPPPICVHWQAGHCRNGASCAFGHPQPATRKEPPPKAGVRSDWTSGWALVCIFFFLFLFEPLGMDLSLLAYSTSSTLLFLILGFSKLTCWAFFPPSFSVALIIPIRCNFSPRGVNVSILCMHDILSSPA